MLLRETPIICTVLLCCVCIHLAVLGMTYVKLHPGHGVLRGHWKIEVILNMTYLQVTLEQGVLPVSSGEGTLCNTKPGKGPKRGFFLLESTLDAGSIYLSLTIL